MTDFEHST